MEALLQGPIEKGGFEGSQTGIERIQFTNFETGGRVETH
jgi:hypothetical protein